MAFYDSIKLEKGMYKTGKTLTQVLEELDPSENYKGSELEGLDAYQRQLKRFDIRTGGSHSDRVQKFFDTTDSAALFPEYISRAVAKGMESADRLGDIIAAKTVIDGVDYRSVVSDPEDDDKALKPVSEGAQLPQTNVHTSENLVHLIKRGRMLSASYEAIKYQRIDLFTVTLKQIGAYIARQQMNDAIDVLINGDGNNNAASSISVATSGTLTYSDLINLWGSLAPYELNTILAPTAVMQKLLSLSEMKDAVAGLSFHGTGKMISPLGASLIHARDISGSRLIGLDKNCALEMVQSGNIETETDKLIDRQLQRTTISCTAGFAKLFPESAKILSI